MPRSRKYVIFFLILGMLSLLLLAMQPTVALASSDNQTSCEFQPPASSRQPTEDVIMQVKPYGYNITWDNSLIGLHRWNSSQWPGVDYLVDTTVAFTNGGVVAWVGVDGAGGGNSIIIDGQGPCQGWRQFFGHLSYDPTTVYSVGDVIGPDDIVGRPGCSGFEGNCQELGSKIPPHNHTTLGFWSNIFSFDDGTVPEAAGGYWWIHPGKVEGEASTQVVVEEQTPLPETAVHFDEQTEYISGEMPSVAATAPTNLLVQIVGPAVPYKNFVIIITALIAIVFVAGVIYSDEFRSKTVPFVCVIVVGIAAIALLSRTQALQISLFAPSRNNDDSYLSSFSEDSYIADLSQTVDTSLPEEDTTTSNVTTGDCRLPTSYPDKILRWCDLIEGYATNNDLDPALVAAVILQESGGDPIIMSHAGAVGLMQIMPRDGIAASAMCANGPCFANRPSIAELQDPETNIEFGTQYLRWTIDYYGSTRDGLLHYGPRDVGYSYADIVIGIYNRYK